FLSPDLSYDGETILFAYTEVADRPRRYTWTPDNTYHVFGVRVDGSNLTQLTDGKWNDFDPCWMPNGRIVFMSERRGGFGRCHGRPVPTFTLHTMEPDGSDLTCISYHETNEWHPSIDNNGMIVYTRWDYVDRGFNQAHHPWITTPDGRDARAIQGNYATSQRHRPHMEMDVRAIPGSHRLVATAAGHHAQAYGSFIIINPHVEDDDRMAALKRLTPEVRFPEAEQSNRSGQKYATAWPLSEEFYLCVYDLDGETRRGPRNNFGVYLLDAFGNKELLYRDPAISCLSPIPLKPRPRPPVVPHLTAVGKPRSIRSRSDTSKSGRARKGAPRARTNVPDFGTVGLTNVYESRNSWPDGTSIKSLRIIQVLPKTTPLADRPRVGYGKQKNARVVLGTVPVEADGSAHFRLPANKPVYFQALDADGIAVQSMRSDVYVHPGEQLLCRGCHEPRNGAPAQPKGYGLAFQREPSEIKPEVEGSNPFSYPRLVQPVLDKNCVPCHTKNRKAPDLGRGDWKKSRERWYTSYHNLRKHAFFFDNQVFTTPRTIPGRFGARASRLYKMLSAGHNKLKLSKEDMRRITLWLECNSDFFGSYDNIEAQCRGEVVKPTLE
ncbi:MAG: HzsA-related protein, partial [Planctomycetota bacterium]